jgi:hypothetical protein
VIRQVSRFQVQIDELNQNVKYKDEKMQLLQQEHAAQRAAWSEEKQQLQSQLDGARREVEEISKHSASEIEKIRTQNEALVATLRSEMAAEIEERNKLAEAKSQVENTAAELRGELENSSRRTVQLEGEIKQLNQKLFGLELEFTESQERLAVSRSETETLSTATRDMEIQLTVSQEAAKTLGEQVHSLSLELNQVREELAVATENGTQAAANARALDDQVTALDAELRALHASQSETDLQHRRTMDELELNLAQEREISEVLAREMAGLHNENIHLTVASALNEISAKVENAALIERMLQEERDLVDGVDFLEKSLTPLVNFIHSGLTPRGSGASSSPGMRRYASGTAIPTQSGAGGRGPGYRGSASALASASSSASTLFPSGMAHGSSNSSPLRTTHHHQHYTSTSQTSFGPSSSALPGTGGIGVDSFGSVNNGNGGGGGGGAAGSSQWLSATGSPSAPTSDSSSASTLAAQQLKHHEQHQQHLAALLAPLSSGPRSRLPRGGGAAKSNPIPADLPHRKSRATRRGVVSDLASTEFDDAAIEHSTSDGSASGSEDEEASDESVDTDDREDDDNADEDGLDAVDDEHFGDIALELLEHEKKELKKSKAKAKKKAGKKERRTKQRTPSSTSDSNSGSYSGSAAVHQRQRRDQGIALDTYAKLASESPSDTQMSFGVASTAQGTRRPPFVPPLALTPLVRETLMRRGSSPKQINLSAAFIALASGSPDETFLTAQDLSQLTSESPTAAPASFRSPRILDSPRLRAGIVGHDIASNGLASASKSSPRHHAQMGSSGRNQNQNYNTHFTGGGGGGGLLSTASSSSSLSSVLSTGDVPLSSASPISHKLRKEWDSPRQSGGGPSGSMFAGGDAGNNGRAMSLSPRGRR